MTNKNTFRPSSRTRRIKKVANLVQIGCSRGNIRSSIGMLRNFRSASVDQYMWNKHLFHPCQISTKRNHKLDGGIINDECRAIFWKGCGEWHIGSTHLHHSQKGDVSLGRAIKQQTNAIARLHAMLNQQSRELIGALIKLLVWPRPSVKNDRDRACKLLCKPLKKISSRSPSSPARAKSAPSKTC